MKTGLSQEGITVSRSGFITLPSVVDENDGVLAIAETGKAIGFDFKRVYYITNLGKSSVRGKHAHRKLHQVIFCVRGKFRLCLDDGARTQAIEMDRPNRGVVLGPGLWHVMDAFSEDCVILVFASDVYDEKDYIRDYDTFLDFTERQ